MTPHPQPLEIVLKFTSSRPGKDSDDFEWKPETYRVEIVGKSRSATFSWNEPWLRQALESWDDIDTQPQLAERISKCLLDFLGSTSWAVAEEKIKRALSEDPLRPVHLTLRADNAEEVYSLPWELLRFNSGERLVSLNGYLLQYEWPREECPAPRFSPRGRILVAYSCAGGWVPAEEHIAAIRDACQRADFSFDPVEDVLEDVSRGTLAAKLRETDRPVTVLHLLCHGTKVGGHGYGLTFSSKTSASEKVAVDATELRDLIFQSVRRPPPRLVVLCSCQGGDSHSPAPLLGSPGRMFHQQGVSAVIASRLPLTCDGSTVLTRTLYERLLVHQDNLRTAITQARRKIHDEVRSRDWLSLQLYARAGDGAALTPFKEPPVPAREVSGRRLLFVRHEAYAQVAVEPLSSDLPALFAGRRPETLSIDQRPQLEQRDWTNLEEAVRQLRTPDGVLRRAYAERDTDVAYYGFPYVPLAALAGHLAKTRRVQVLEYLEDRFIWEPESAAPFAALTSDVRQADAGSAARLRIAVSAPVHLDDCRQVLPDAEVKVDFHFALEKPGRFSVRREAQLNAYLQVIQDAIKQYIVGVSDRSVKSVHIFAAIPVSMAFLLGHALAETWLPECFIYNYGAQERPVYKWRLSLQAAARGKRSVKVIKQSRRS